jgi:ribosomal protein L11 methyltransferase
MSLTYYEVILVLEPFEPEIANSFLWDLNALGTAEKEDCLLAYFEENDKLENEIKNRLEEIKKQNLIKDYRILINKIEDKNWNEEWEKTIRVIEVGKKLAIKPSFKDYSNAENRIVIQIDPRMSFGTGEHITTKMMLEFLEKYVSGGETILDCGTGTGILAIAAIKLGAKKALAFDIDECSYLNAKENISLNDVESQIEVRRGDFLCVKDSEKDFDIIAANILKPILKDKAEFLNDKLKNGGLLALSGFLNSDIVELSEIYENSSFELIEQKSESDWAMLVFRKI